MALKFIGTEEYKIPTNILEYERLGAATKYKFGDERGSTFDVALQPGTFATTKGGEYFEVLQGGALKPIAEQEALSGRLLVGTQIPEFAKQYLQYAPGATVSPTRGDIAQKEMVEATQGTKPAGGVITSAGTRGATAEEALAKERAILKPQGVIASTPTANILAMTAMTKPIVPLQLPSVKTPLTPTEFELLRKAKGVSEANFDQYFSRDTSGNIYFKGADKRLYENRGLTANADSIQALAKFYLGRPATSEELKLANGNLGAAEDVFAQKRGEAGKSGLTDLMGGFEKTVGADKIEGSSPVVDIISNEATVKIADTIKNISQNVLTEVPKQIATLQNELQVLTQSRLDAEKVKQEGLVSDLKTLAFESSQDKIKNILAEYNITQNIQALTDIQNKVNTIQASLDLGILEQAGRVVPMGIISRRQDALNKQAAAQIGALNASAAVIQGNIDGAYRMAGLVIDAMTDDRQAQISAYNYLLGLNEKNIVKLETDVKDAIDEQIELLNKENEQMQKNKDSLLKLIVENPVAASNAGITLTDDYEDAVKKITPFIAEIYRSETDLKKRLTEAQIAEKLGTSKGYTENDIATWARNILNDVANISSVPAEIRTEVSNKISEIQKSNPTQLTPLQQKQAAIIADDIRSEVAYRDMVDVRNGYQAVKVGVEFGNGQGDLAAINGFQKMIDPGVSVRTEEFKTVEAAQGFLSQWMNLPSKFLEGDRMTDEARKRFKAVADSLYNEKAQTYNETVGERYKARASVYKIPFNLIGEDFPIYGEQEKVIVPKTVEEYLNQKPEEKNSVINLIKENPSLSDQEIMDILNFNQPLSMGVKNSGYLNNYGQITGEGSDYWEYGLDVDLKKGDPVTAPVGGKIIAMGYNGGFGNQVKILGDDGNTYWLSHLDGFNVKKGDNVKTGQIIGKGGNTGRVIAFEGGDGSHLDITVQDQNGRFIPPSKLRNLLA